MGLQPGRWARVDDGRRVRRRGRSPRRSEPRPLGALATNPGWPDPGAGPRRHPAWWCTSRPGALTGRTLHSGLVHLMGSIGDSFDEAVIESFWHGRRSNDLTAGAGRGASSSRTRYSNLETQAQPPSNRRWITPRGGLLARSPVRSGPPCHASQEGPEARSNSINPTVARYRGACPCQLRTRSGVPQTRGWPHAVRYSTTRRHHRRRPRSGPG